jgi:hypothetical protein
MANEGADATIAILERGIEEAEQKIRSLRTAINTICAEFGMPARYPESVLSPVGLAAKLSQIQDDTFYGKKQTPAMREYLEMRKAQGHGPAKPREFFDALKAGGYQFEAKDDEIAIVGLRALLRTQPHIFHRLPQGTYGLTSWYPDARRPKDESGGSIKKKKKVRRVRLRPIRRERLHSSQQNEQAEGPGKRSDAPKVVPLKKDQAV